MSEIGLVSDWYSELSDNYPPIRALPTLIRNSDSQSEVRTVTIILRKIIIYFPRNRLFSKGADSEPKKSRSCYSSDFVRYSDYSLIRFQGLLPSFLQITCRIQITCRTSCFVVTITCSCISRLTVLNSLKLPNSHDSLNIGSVINLHAGNYGDLCPHIYLTWENAFRSISISVPLILSEINVSIGLFALLLFYFPMFYCKRQNSC